MSFQFSMAEGVGAAAEGTRTGAVADFGGGGGRLGLEGSNGGGALGACSVGWGGLGFFSQLFREDCIVAEKCWDGWDG
jgi:hypothetical protein